MGQASMTRSSSHCQEAFGAGPCACTAPRPVQIGGTVDAHRQGRARKDRAGMAWAACMGQARATPALPTDRSA